MLLLDTCALIYDALTPSRLSKRARNAIDEAERTENIFISDISLWEVAMLVHKGRLDPGTETGEFIRLALAARAIGILPITVEVAVRACGLSLPGDPADRIIAATAAEHGATLVTSDKTLRKSAQIKTLW